MPKTRPHLIAISLILLISVISIIAVTINRKGIPWKTTKAVSQKSNADRILENFERHTKKINLPNLKASQFPDKNDLEVRSWVDGFPFRVDCVVLRRINNSWSAVHIHDTASQEFRLIQKEVATPKSGWEITWQKLVSSGILILPDAAEVNCNVSVIDGSSIVVETNTNGIYRAYCYGNPSLADCAEARKIIEILVILLDEFSLDLRR